jgi:type I restriction enzyme S subunit
MSARAYTPYPAYKDSGVEWLGEIPVGWEVKRLRFVSDSNPVPSEVRGLPSDTEVSFVPMEAVGEYGGLALETTKLLSDVKAGYTYFRDGDVVIAKITPCFENGKGALADGLTNGIAFGTTELHVLRARATADSRFAFYVTLSDAFRRVGEADMYGAGGQKRISESFVRNFRIGLPSLPEQLAIAASLDRETARMDALVAKKERLIALLQERRTALITRAVTKGLDPAAPMKDSGVEWLGEIPAHWEVKRIKLFARIGNGSTPSRENPEYWSGDYPWLNSGVVNFHEVVEGSDFVTDVALRECHLPIVTPPAVLVGITGEGRTRGMATMLRIESTISQHLAAIQITHADASAEYLHAVLLSAYQYLRDESGGAGSTKGALTCEQLGNLAVPFPPLNQQLAIVSYIDHHASRIDTLIARVRAAIARLHELRTALISAAVTGKIDVREVAQ